jgi:hypothetical protein
MTSLSTRNLSIALLLSTMAAAGCGGTTTDVPPAGDGGTGNETGADVATGPAQTFDYVISALSIDQAMGGMAPNPMTHGQGVAGFNLDNRFSGPAGAMPADCAHGDFFSTTDTDQNMGTCTAGMARGGAACNGGVDNQLPEIGNIVSGFGTDIRMTIDEQLSMGKIAILVRIADVNGTPGPTLNDNSVNVTVYTTGRPMFASCAMRSMPGAAYAIDTTTQEATFTGRIVNGRLVVNPPAAAGMANFTLNLPIMNMNIPLRLFQTQLRVNMTPDTGTAGNLGGYIPLRDLSTMLATLLPAGIPPATVQTVLASLVDVQLPMGDAMGCTAPNGGISLGLGFTTTRATIQAARVTGAQAGMCGSM